MKKEFLFPIIYLVLLTICIAGFSISRYESTTDANDSAIVAKPVINIEPIAATFTDYKNKEINIPQSEMTGGIKLTELQPGSKLVYDFAVRNYDGVNTNQVQLKYKINAVFNPSAQNIPLTAVITPKGSFGTDAYGFTPMGCLSQTDNQYELTVTWDPSDSKGDYTNTFQYVNIEINAEQVN